MKFTRYRFINAVTQLGPSGKKYSKGKHAKKGFPRRKCQQNCILFCGWHVSGPGVGDFFFVLSIGTLIIMTISFMLKLVRVAVVWFRHRFANASVRCFYIRVNILEFGFACFWSVSLENEHIKAAHDTISATRILLLY